MEKAYDTFNDVLVNLFNEIMDIEARAIITPEFKDITNNDMHVIEAIGLDGHKKMTDIAKTLSVTTGTLTKSMDGLVRKQYVNRNRSEEDKRVVLISLTEKGVRAFHHHENFHKILIKRATRGMSEEEICFLINILAKLKDSFRLNFKIGEMVNDMLQD